MAGLNALSVMGKDTNETSPQAFDAFARYVAKIQGPIIGPYHVK